MQRITCGSTSSQPLLSFAQRAGRGFFHARPINLSRGRPSLRNNRRASIFARSRAIPRPSVCSWSRTYSMGGRVGVAHLFDGGSVVIGRSPPLLFDNG